MLDTCWRHEHRIVNGGLEVRRHTVLARRLSTLKVPLFDDPRLELLFLGFALLVREIRASFFQEADQGARTSNVRCSECLVGVEHCHVDIVASVRRWWRRRCRRQQAWEADNCCIHLCDEILSLVVGGKDLESVTQGFVEVPSVPSPARCLPAAGRSPPGV